MITNSRYPGLGFDDFVKYRLTYEGGRIFIERFLKQLDTREDLTDFTRRKEMTYCPAFAKEGINEIRNAIYQRMPEIIRADVTPSYTLAATGDEGGVDLKNNSMNKFIGKEVLPELLIMGRVGVYVDMPQVNPDSLLAQFVTPPHPFLYMYRAEDILNWSYTTRNNEQVITQVLLREYYTPIDENGYPCGLAERFRHIRLTANGVELKMLVRVTNPNTNEVTEVVEEEFLLPLKRIPFILSSLGASLLKDICDYQVGLLNLASSDINYALRSNFPIYVEQYDARTESVYNKVAVLTASGEMEVKTGTDNPPSNELSAGVAKGRRYPMGANSPGFINPSSEPLNASMQKQAEMKEDMRRLLNLAVSNVAVTRASAESKRVDQVGLESGLAAIGMELEAIERQVSKLWAAYEKVEINPIISYPQQYDLKTNRDRIEEAKGYKELKGLAPSRKFSLEIGKLAVRSLLDGRVTNSRMEEMMAEIDKATYTTGDAKEIEIDVNLGLVSAVTASDARGYHGAIETPIAQAEHAKRLAEISKAQTSGNPDTGNQGNVKDLNPSPQPLRGDGK